MNDNWNDCSTCQHSEQSVRIEPCKSCECTPTNYEERKPPKPHKPLKGGLDA